ncbi:DEAD DEAH box helicase [Coemansia sp. RSA 2050]|nr:DEAD DEAH box helicase [Coemansia sp. RSA 2050]KAJ2734747.1 DEAD DEAH box helicase [Coemansia sp. BCRC 34962]
MLAATIDAAGHRQPRRLRQLRRLAHTLRPYQQECIDKCLASLRAGIRRQAVSLPVGSGKTVVFSNLIQQIPAPTELATKTLVLAHREELLEQAARQIQAASPQLSIAIDQGTRQANPAADVIVASVATLGRMRSTRLQRHDASRYKCIIIDEAHHAAASSYTRILEHFQGGPFVWGCSATLHRHDRLRLTDVFDQIVYQKPFLEMVREGWLCPMRITTVRTACNISGVRSQAGDFATAALSQAVNVDARNLAVVRSHATLAEGRKSTLVFAVDVAHAHDLVSYFAHYGTRAEAVLGTTTTAERERILSDFRSGKLPVLVNCGILTEGTDIPNIDCVMMARPTRSSVLFQQMLGRGMRKSPGKQDCLVIDFVDSFRRSISLITLPTLLGLDPALVLKDTDVLDQESMMRQLEAQRQALETEAAADAGQIKLGKDAEMVRRFEEIATPQPAPNLPGTLGTLKELGFVAVEHLNPLDFFAASTSVFANRMASASRKQRLESISCGDMRLPQLSSFAWVCLTPDRYLLSYNNSLYFVGRQAESGEETWVGSYRQVKTHRAAKVGTASKRPSGKMSYTKEKPLDLTSRDLEGAIRGMDTYVTSRMKPHEVRLLNRGAPWRSRPPTMRQLAALTKLGMDIPEAVHEWALAADSGQPKAWASRASSRVVKMSTFRHGPPPDVTCHSDTPHADTSHSETITRGSAMNLILRLTHGSSKAWSDLKKAKERIDALNAKALESARRAVWAAPEAPPKPEIITGHDKRWFLEN